MKTQPLTQVVELSPSRRTPLFSENVRPNHLNGPQSNHSPAVDRVRMRDSLAFSICLAIVAALTGAMLYAHIAVTISPVTTGLFYFSLAGTLFFAFKAIWLARQRFSSTTADISLN